MFLEESINSFPLTWKETGALNCPPDLKLKYLYEPLEPVLIVPTPVADS